ncbi:MAG: GGDEF domain-containing protein [Rhodoferax sp.]|nr:GGDEF domain-containing protein [Rhodoferax sp.]
MLNTPHLLDQLVSLTGIRDLELLETSLLQTLNGFIHPTGLALYKLSSRGEMRSQLVYGDDHCRVVRENFEVRPELTQAFLEHQTGDKARNQIAVEDGVLTVMTVMDSRSTTTYLVISSAAALRDMDGHMIDGMLQIYRNFCQLLQESQTDSLTGLANRKTFDECFSRVYELQPFGDSECTVEVDHRQPKEQATYWLSMVDIDHFKSVNDRFGHLYGDEVLILLAHLLKNALRNDDLVFRFGGEEFVLMIRCNGREEAAGLLERLRKSVESQDIPQVGQVTISLGATEMMRNTFAGTLLDYADKALYYSQQNGRNRLTFFEDMVSQGLATREAAPDENLDFF